MTAEVYEAVEHVQQNPGPLVTLRSNQILILSGNSQSRGCVYVSLTLWQVRMRGKLFLDMPWVDGVNDQYGVFDGSQTTLVVSQRGIRSGMPILSVAGRCLRNRKFSIDCHDTVFLFLHQENVRKTTSTGVVVPTNFPTDWNCRRKFPVALNTDSLLGGVANPQNLQSVTLSADWSFFRSVAPHTQSSESPSYKANGSPSPTETPEVEFASLEGGTKKHC